MSKKKKTKAGQKGESLTRRGFLKGAGLTAAGTMVAGSGIIKLSAREVAKQGHVADVARIQMKVNGKLRELTIEPRTTLADALRINLQLTGTKVGCNRGACSACTVWLDGTPVLACSTLAIEVGEREVTTIEGLSKKGKLHPVQQAFIEHDATQCGYCTPGMIMSTAHLLHNNPHPSAEEINESISGNFCRCGTHPKVISATLEASRNLKTPGK